MLITLLFAVFFLLALGAFLSQCPGAETALFTSCLYGLIWLAWIFFAAKRRPPPFGLMGILQGLVPWLGLLLCYNLMKPLVPVLHPQLYDALLNRMQMNLLGHGPSLWVETLKGHALLTDLFCVFYLGLFAWLIGLLVFHCYLRRALYQRFMQGLIVVYFGGFLGYLLFPAVGPRFAYPREWSWLEGGVMFQVTQVFVAHMGSRTDVFPSLHGAISAYLLFWQAGHDRRGLVWGAPLAVGIWLSTLLLGFHYFPDLVSGLLLAGLAAWSGPHLERIAGLWRRSQHPPLVWLLNLIEGSEDDFGRLAGRFSALLPLGAETSPGLLVGGAPRNRSEAPLRQALKDLGGGPFWVRPSEISGTKTGGLPALKPLSLEQVIRRVFESPSKRFYVVQKALKVSAMGVCRSFPSPDGKLTDVEIRMTSLPRGEALILRLNPNKTLFKGWLDTPWNYFPPSFPLKGFELFDVVKLTRQWAGRLGQFAEVEWALSDGKVFVLDGRPVRGKNPAAD